MGFDPNQARDKDGKWTAGASAGDHQAEQPRDQSMRRVPGHGTLPRSKPVAKHNGAESVGTSSGGGGSGGGLASNAKRRPKHMMTREEQNAKGDRTVRNKGVDQRAYPYRGPEATAATDLMRPMAGLSATPGRFKFKR